jgi:hypothetical protein
MPKKKIEPFPDIGGESYQPRAVLIHTESPAYMDKISETETIPIVRDLTEKEQARLQKAKTPEEVRDLLYLIKEINEPTEYEVDFRKR